MVGFGGGFVIVMSGHDWICPDSKHELDKVVVKSCCFGFEAAVVSEDQVKKETIQPKH